MKEILKAELEKLKLRNYQLKALSTLKEDKQNLITSGILSAVGQSLTPTIHKVGMSLGVKRTKTGSYRVHGKTYRNKKLAEKTMVKRLFKVTEF